MQRFFDFIFALIALLLLSPLLIPISILLKITGEGEIFYIQKRVGKNGKIFGLYKFATMLKNSPNIGAGELTLRNDPRVLPVGKFLRKSKINELPQLLNIIVGDMSIVGPRPMVPNTYSDYPQTAQNKLNTIRPGLTGIGSIVFRDEEKFLEGKTEPRKFYRSEIIPYKSDLEIWYVNNNSLLNYFKCIFLTAWVIFFPRSKIIKIMFKELPNRPSNLD
jgi:lipopolysaccharide/colanic/teichoic acid biosynthesis glycosyltransferase